MKQLFNSLSSELIQKRKHVHEVCRQFSRSPSRGNLKRLKSLFKECGQDVFIESGFHCDYADQLTLGDRVYININCTILDGGEVRIGEDSLIGPNVQILTVTHDINPTERLKKNNYAQEVTIGKNVWIAAGVIILPGVKIGDNSVIGAGSLVSKNVDPDSLYLGNPAVKVKAL
ncbi:sugar O-acetyltransferase [Pseudoalteromonas denitrificans]|uniref:Maltose O-acetyltransferase n=1 Tax=Pseudoalteromonas denitrificans DSM 6059 TaxID=1123010 RepID=A0A1I1MK52_9GAMM|nr:sugar O-acetyltransferase [Pseudoalteromonas denitrificans]SFC85202.1 maltose O-acetyltransferase [Pseudoalteromonas denitrificans DSM 6059]